MDEPFCPQHPKSTDFNFNHKLLLSLERVKHWTSNLPQCYGTPGGNTLWYVAFQNFFYGLTNIELYVEICIITDFPQAPFHDIQSLFVLTFQVGLPQEASSQSPKTFFLAPPKTYGGWWDVPMCVCLRGAGGECPTRDTQEQT